MDASDASLTAAVITAAHPSGSDQVERDLDRDGGVDASDAAQIAAGDHRAALSGGLASGLLSSYASAASPPPGHGRGLAKQPHGGGPATQPRGVGNRLGFTGHVFNPETGLYTARFCHDSPRLGRFIQRDPAGFGDGMSQYAGYFAQHGVGHDALGLAYDPLRSARDAAIRLLQDLRRKQIEAELQELRDLQSNIRLLLIDIIDQDDRRRQSLADSEARYVENEMERALAWLQQMLEDAALAEEYTIETLAKLAVERGLERGFSYLLAQERAAAEMELSMLGPRADRVNPPELMRIHADRADFLKARLSDLKLASDVAGRLVIVADAASMINDLSNEEYGSAALTGTGIAAGTAVVVLLPAYAHPIGIGCVVAVILLEANNLRMIRAHRDEASEERVEVFWEAYKKRRDRIRKLIIQLQTQDESDEE